MDENVDWGALERLWGRVEEALPEARHGAAAAAAAAAAASGRKPRGFGLTKTQMKDRYREVYNQPAIDGSTANSVGKLSRTENAREWKRSRQRGRRQQGAVAAAPSGGLE